MAIMGAVGGYLLIRALLMRMPDKPDEGFEFRKPVKQLNCLHPATMRNFSVLHSYSFACGDIYLFNQNPDQSGSKPGWSGYNSNR